MKSFRYEVHQRIRLGLMLGAETPVSMLEELTDSLTDLFAKAIAEPGQSEAIDDAVGRVLLAKGPRDRRIAAIVDGEKRIEYDSADVEIFCRVYATERTLYANPPVATKMAIAAVAAFPKRMSIDG